jgi:hypothetical protein
VTCEKCGEDGTDTILTPELIHYGKQVCAGCRKFEAWIPKPENHIFNAQNKIVAARDLLASMPDRTDETILAEYHLKMAAAILRGVTAELVDG